MACGRSRGSNGEKAPVDLRADRQYRLRLTYDLTATGRLGDATLPARPSCTSSPSLAYG
jgi:hypothetical protein